MRISIKNKALRVEIDTLGAELASIKDKEGKEYLWQGDPAYWTGRAYNLFPIVARLTGGSYTWQEKTYQMGTHGFTRHSEFTVTAQKPASVTFLLTENEQTLAQYPFRFRFFITYALRHSRLTVTYRVENPGEAELPFSVGGHPGFNLPLEEGLQFTDYAVRFDPSANPTVVRMSEDCFVLPERTPLRTENGDLRLRHDLFDHDAVVLENAGESVLLTAGRGKSLLVRFPKMKYLGLWHKPKTDAPYLCIEPWASLPTRYGEKDDFSTKPDFEHLAAGEVYENGFSVEIT